MWPPLPEGYQFNEGAPSMFARLHALERAADTLFPPSRLPPGDDVLHEVLLSRAASDGVLVVVEHAGELVGASIGVPDGTDLHLLQLAVHPEHARRGLGRALLEATVSKARVHWQAITLTTFADLPFNAPFYQDVGFDWLDEPQVSEAIRSALRAERLSGMTQRVAMKRMLR